MTEHIDERREFLRMEHTGPVKYQELKGGRLSRKSDILSKNISASGLLFTTENVPPALSSILKVELDDKMLNVCHEIESDLLIMGKAVLGRVVRISEGEPGKSYDVGVCFLRRKNLSDQEITRLINETENE